MSGVAAFSSIHDGDAGRPIFILKCRAPSWISIDQPEGAVMQTKSGRLTAARGVLLMVVLCASTIGCSGCARTVDRFYGIVNSPAAEGKLVPMDVRDQNGVTITPIGTI